MVVALTDKSGNYNAADLGNIIDSQINDNVARLDGVGSIQGFYTPYAMRIWLDPFKLNQYKLTSNDVISAIQAQNNQVAVGNLGDDPSVPGQELNLTAISSSQLGTAPEFREHYTEDDGKRRDSDDFRHRKRRARPALLSVLEFL